MCLLLESIRCENGRFEDLNPHIERMVRSRTDLWGCSVKPDLIDALRNARDGIGRGYWKVRVLYDTEIREVEATPYVARPCGSAALIEAGDVEYAHKFARRPELDRLTERARSAGADTALIAKSGAVTDFSYANAAFYDGSVWWTPDRPLLEGTRRQRLLAAGRIKTTTIRAGDLRNFSLAAPINAMLDLGEISMPTSAILSIE